MREKLLFVGGVVQALALLFHLALPRLAAWQLLLRDQPGPRAGYLELFNVHVAYTFGFFSVLSLAYSRELLTTPVGRAITVLIAGFWLLRAASELIWPPAPSPRALALCLSVALLYAGVALGGHTGIANCRVHMDAVLELIRSGAIRPERVVSEIMAWQGAAEALADPSLKPVVVRDELVPA